MPLYTNTAALPREELKPVVVQGSAFDGSDNIYPLVLPLFGVSKRTAHYVLKKIQDTDIGRVLSSKYIRQPGSNFERKTITYADATFSVILRGQEVQIPDEHLIDLEDNLPVEQDASNEASKIIEATNELLTANAMTSTASFGSATNPLVAYTSANLATINFVQDIYNSLERGRNKGERFNTIIIPELVFQQLRQSTLLKSFIVQMTGFSPVAGGFITPTQIQKSFEDEGITQVLIGRGRYNTAAQFATPSYTKFWPTTYVIVCRAGSKFSNNVNGIETVAGVGCNSWWQDYTPNDGYVVETYRDEPRKSNIVRVNSSVTPVVLNANCADLIATQANY